MVFKLIKHDFLDRAKDFLIIYGMWAVLLIYTYFMFYVPDSLSDYSTLLFGFLIFGTLVAGAVLFIRAIFGLLYTKLFSREGYFTFTLPVETWQNVLSKMVATLMWTIITLLVGLLVIAGFAMIAWLHADQAIPFEALFQFIRNVMSEAWWWQFLLSLFVSLISFYICIIFVSSIANSSYIRSHRILAAIGLYFLVSYLVDFLSAMIFGWNEGITTMMMAGKYLGGSLYWYTLLFRVVIAIAYYFGAKYFIEKKLEILQ